MDTAIAELADNPEQHAAVMEKGHCVVLAGPGSGKTKTLTTAMARALLEDVAEPRGIACITYNNECALELENRLGKLGVSPDRRTFIGTVHSFALAQVILPYARCVLLDFPADPQIATEGDRRGAVEAAYDAVYGDNLDPHARWEFAREKRMRDVDRTHENWRGRNPQLADFIEAYEGMLRSRGLIDYDDMPLLACRMLKEHGWIRRAIYARFPILFIDEYQDLGYALHHLVEMLCFDAGCRLFAVGDVDQSIYGFAHANPRLLSGLARRPDVQTIQLNLNYRCGSKIIEASMAALGEERSYRAPAGAEEGQVSFVAVRGGKQAQAQYAVGTLVPELIQRGNKLDEIAILYRSAGQGNMIAQVATAANIPFMRADSNALVKRSSRWSRLIENFARWVVGGWKDCDPPFHRLVDEAVSLVIGFGASEKERYSIQTDLIKFLQAYITGEHVAHDWLVGLRREVIERWRLRATVVSEDWAVIDEMIARTDPANGECDWSLAHFGGRVNGHGRLNLSTLHSAKGREFDAVILFDMSEGSMPNSKETEALDKLREARRLFYVGVTRARRELFLLHADRAPSQWVTELEGRVRH